MTLAALTERRAVLSAIDEFNSLGRDAFLEKYGFGPANRYFLLYRGARYDSKAIAGVAHGYQHPEAGPLRPDAFSGGENTVAKRLRELGFEMLTADLQPWDRAVSFTMGSVWLEMSRDAEHGGGTWGFTESLWSPSKKSDGSRWPYWESVSQVEEGDPVLHLRGMGSDAAFVGYSVAASNAYATTSRPPSPGQWADYGEFYRVHLSDFTPFPDPIALQEIFERKDHELRVYFNANKDRPKASREHLFYVIQSGRLQCQNGAYLTEASEELRSILFDNESEPDEAMKAVGQTPAAAVSTGTVMRQFETRVGQRRFSQAVRDNYGHQCCFPGCDVQERPFLRGAHIARWADKPDLRGDVSNGLCLCLVHDKAFEIGLFTLDFDNRIWSTDEQFSASQWARANIAPHVGAQITLGPIEPSEEALFDHWDRTELYPE